MIKSVANTGKVQGTYNLSVADYETYFVGTNKVLVHNCPHYEVPGDRTPSGRSYVGRTKHDNVSKRGSRDGRKRQDEDKIGETTGDLQKDKIQEQKNINEAGGVKKLDNKRNEIKESDWEKFGIDPPKSK